MLNFFIFLVIFCINVVSDFNKDIKVQRHIEDLIEMARLYLGQNKEKNEIADILKIKEMTGMAFGLVCGAIVVLLLVTFLNDLGLLFLAQDRALDDFGTWLLSLKAYREVRKVNP